MKALFSILLLVSFSQTKGQDVFPMENGKIAYTAVVPVDSATPPTVLVANAKQFFNSMATKYNTGITQEINKLKDHIIHADESGISSNIRFSVSNNFMSTWYYQMVATIEIKQGRYRYTLDNLQSIGNNLIGPMSATDFEPENKSKNIKYYKKMDAAIKDIISNLEQTMKAKPKGDF